MAYVVIRKTNSLKGRAYTASTAERTKETKISKTNKKKYIKYKSKTMDARALVANGFNLDWTYEQAYEHGERLNALDSVRRKEVLAKNKASEKLTDIEKVKNSIIPDAESDEFITYMEENWSSKNKYNLRKQVLHWRLLEEILTHHVKLHPHEFYKERNKFYNYFEKEKFSFSYVQKVLKVINMWGEFKCDKDEKYFKKVPNPKGFWLEKIQDASDADGKGATPLTIELLDSLKHKLLDTEWKYLRATFWLGLRPSELDLILKDKTKVRFEKYKGTSVICVYQTKLEMLPEPKRWKNIPLYCDEMEEAAKDIKLYDKNPENLLLKKPKVKDIKKAAAPMFLDEKTGLPIEDNGVGLYSGRKGFTDLHLELGQDLEDISQWAGHASIERTWSAYKNKFSVKFNPIKKGRAG